MVIDIKQPGLGTHDWAHLCSQVNKLRLKEIMYLTQSHISSERAAGTRPTPSSLCALHKTVRKILWNRAAQTRKLLVYYFFSLFTRH